MTYASFIETPEFPRDISYGSAGGPQYSTKITTLQSGYEYRNRNWQYPLHTYDVMYGVKDITQLGALINFFHIVGGAGTGFRYYDWIDCTSKPAGTWKATPSATDQLIGTGDGSNRVFQLVKTYNGGGTTQTRLIKKPIGSTIKIAVDGTETSHFTLDANTGIVTFSMGYAPANGKPVTAGYQFNVPVRFKDDSLSVAIPEIEVATSQVQLVEIRI